jgi:hypothetical protein
MRKNNFNFKIFFQTVRILTSILTLLVLLAKVGSNDSLKRGLKAATKSLIITEVSCFTSDIIKV